MHKDYLYTSVFADLIKDYITSRREAGFMYDNPAYWLYRFDQFCFDEKLSEATVTKTLYQAWAAKTDTETKTTQNNRLQALRNFCIYLNTIGITAYVPCILPMPEKVIPYLMNDKDIQEFFSQVDHYQTTSTVKAFQRLSVEYKVLFRLIYCCGLRNNKACSLKTENIDLNKGTVTIYHSKGRKDRIVYLADDLCNLCADYLRWLNTQLNMQSEWFFPGKYPDHPIRKTSVDQKFNQFWNNTLSATNCDKKPTVHCLRYAFVIKRVNEWMKEDLSLQVMMPYLSNYLGHKDPSETYYYFHQVKDAFQTVHRKDNISARVIPEVQHEE